MKPSLTGNIPSLTPLRGIAALLVAVFHFQSYLLRFVTKDESMFIDKCYLMVDLFFIMSGFLIMHVYKEQFAEKITLKAFKKFVLARFARIYPLHFITLILLVGLFYFESLKPKGLYDPGAIVSHIFLLHSFPLNREVTWNIPSWSISAEWWSYMLFPVLCLFLAKRKVQAIAIIFLGIVATYYAVLYVVPRHDIYDPAADKLHDLNVNYDYGFLRSIAGFMTGMLLYLLYGVDRVRSFFNSDILCGVCMLLIIFALHKAIPDIFLVPGFALLILTLTCNKGKITTGLNNKTLHFLGDISYSIYLIHFLFIIFIEMVAYKFGYRYHSELIFPFFKGAALCILYLLLLIVLSAVSYHIIEKPCRNYINRKWQANNFELQKVQGSLKDA
ncbi:acyltransferase family protein [Ferruginibacter sp. SUN106]|uniref:acyltransferase family protein n=1 Tax=Ferruginibacter sp. SUN106 TaxID=2978348 RepID=UPI003D36A615